MQADSTCFCLGGLATIHVALPAPQPSLTISRVYVYLYQTVSLGAGSHPRLPEAWSSPPRKLCLVMNAFANQKLGEGVDLTEEVRLPTEGGVATASTPECTDTDIRVGHTLVCEVSFVDVKGRKAVFRISRPVFLASVGPPCRFH
jgi:hypothetical protein